MPVYKYICITIVNYHPVGKWERSYYSLAEYIWEFPSDHATSVSGGWLVTSAACLSRKLCVL